ncbi:GNAT family N-acetyltransferase [Paenibacillus sonchi]|uniref:GNAT family N-acetyltransferase n=1 Tax=Paenibacillus sonchi TaxID=373687 RepID=A0A974SA15_9BACL|nr:GNAT family N-acetyltransferase [Paenibacillus sonchi]MCE3200020.1 GNAT family N-acetyltransferase [Paenibacillus sonchi]QQZ59038.1 GNAT family N-acetyltransferase [Paenibacillus sonchi]
MRVERVTTEEQLQEAFRIRQEVFVEEQGVALADEFDDHEKHAEHILLYQGELPVGTARLRSVEGWAKLERICLSAPYRKSGLGSVIIDTLEKMAVERGHRQAKLHGQKQAEGFYQRLGYVTSSPVFMEDGIPHVLMVKQL